MSLSKCKKLEMFTRINNSFGYSISGCKGVIGTIGLTIRYKREDARMVNLNWCMNVYPEANKLLENPDQDLYLDFRRTADMKQLGVVLLKDLFDHFKQPLLTGRDVLRQLGFDLNR